MPQPTDAGPGGVRYIERMDVNQSAIRMGQLGVTDKHPDKVALDVMGQILGEGFSSRLV